MPRTAAVFFDVDFTLIYPGPRFQASGYHDSCARHGITVDPEMFDRAVAGASEVLEPADHIYSADLYLRYTRRIIELMGGSSPGLEAVAQEIYDEWAEHRHFVLYGDTVETLRRLHEAGIRIGLISNSHRCLASFQSHFELDGLIAAAVSSPDHGFMKPHPRVFHAALELMNVPASDSVMVGDSLVHDVRGAMEVGMRGILLARDRDVDTRTDGVPVIKSLKELPALVL